MEIDSRAICK